MAETQTTRMEQIKKDLAPWFKGFHPCYAERSNTKVEYLFLSRRSNEGIPNSFLSLKALRNFIGSQNGRAGDGSMRLALFTDLVPEVPSQEEIVRELSLLIAGLKPASS